MSRDKLVENGPLCAPVLYSIQSLCEAFTAATTAIARNDVGDLEKHIEMQETACSSLLALEREFSSLLKDPRTRGELSQALQKLARENRSYSRLLATTAISHKVMLALCSSYKDSESRATDSEQSPHGLSCEV